MELNRRAILPGLLSAALFMTGCTTSVLSSQNLSHFVVPGGPIVVVAALAPGAREAGEDSVARAIGHSAVASHDFLPGALPKGSPELIARGFETVILVSSAGFSTRDTSALGGENGFSIPGSTSFFRTYRVVAVSLKDQRELFTCVVEARGPGEFPWRGEDVTQTMTAVARTAVQEMRSSGFVR